MVVLADIANGNVDWADIFFLIAVIVFIVGAVASLSPPATKFVMTLVCIGLAFVSLGWLVL